MTPEGYAPPPPQQQSFLSKNWPWLVGGGCVLLLCCGFFGIMGAGFLAAAAEKEAAKNRPTTISPPSKGGPTRPLGDDTDLPELPEPPASPSNNAARVDCGTPGPAGVDCTVKRTGGTTALDACWDLEIDCVNGGKMIGNACGSLGAGEKSATVNMPVDGFDNQAACDAPKFGKVTNLVVTDQ